MGVKLFFFFFQMMWKIIQGVTNSKGSLKLLKIW
jgi:hypothetical protein